MHIATSIHSITEAATNRNGNLTLVVVGATDCHGCERQKKVIKDLEDLYDDVDFYYINIDDDLDGLSRYTIYSTPTTLVLQHEWLVETLVGLQSARAIEDTIARYRVL